MSSQDYLVGSQDLDLIISSDWDYSENMEGSTGNGSSMALFEEAEKKYKCFLNGTVLWPEYRPEYEGNYTSGIPINISEVSVNKGINYWCRFFNLHLVHFKHFPKLICQ